VAHAFKANQRIHIKAVNSSGLSAPPDYAKGKFGTITQQFVLTHVDTGHPADAGTSPMYYVQVEGGQIELIGEDWLEAEA
jgi:hypothetical protein